MSKMSSAEKNEVAVEKAAAEEKTPAADTRGPYKAVKRRFGDEMEAIKKAKKEENGGAEEDDEDEIIEEEEEDIDDMVESEVEEYDLPYTDVEDGEEEEDEENEVEPNQVL